MSWKRLSNRMERIEACWVDRCGLVVVESMSMGGT